MLCDVVSGCIAGMVGFSVGHPIDTIKVQQQIKGFRAFKAAKYIYDMRGFKGYYRGMGLPFVTYGVVNALFFGIYGPVCDFLVGMRSSSEAIVPQDEEDNDDDVIAGTELPDEPPLSKYRQLYYKFRAGFKSENVEATYQDMLIAGAVAGGVQLVLLTPVELVKVKLQSQFRAPIFTGPVDCFFKLYRHSGVLGLYKGFSPMAIRDVPGCGLWMVSYEYLRRRLPIEGCPVIWAQVIAGGTAGVISWMFVIPFDVIKSKMQADDHRNPVYKNMTHCATDIFHEKGCRGLFRGFFSASLRAFPVNAVSFAAYQLLKDSCTTTTGTTAKT